MGTDNVVPLRKKLEDEREAVNHEFQVGNLTGMIRVGLYADGTPGEIFLDIAKEGSTLSGFADGFSLLMSLALQYGVPLEKIVEKLRDVRFEPAGLTSRPDIKKEATSVFDYIACWLEKKFLEKAVEAEVEVAQAS